MNQVNLKDANQKFSQLIKQVDKEGIVAITRYGKEVYYMMTKDIYDGNNSFESQMVSRAKSGLWVKTEDEYICQILIKNDLMRILKIDPRNGLEEIYWCSETTVPADAVSFRDEDILEIIAEEDAEIHYGCFHPMARRLDKREDKMNKHLQEAMKQYNEDSPEMIPAKFIGHKVFMI